MSLAEADVASFPDSVALLWAALGREERDVSQFRSALRRLDWALRLTSDAAPGYVYLAGLCHGVPVGGGGDDLFGAAARLAGEASEALGQAMPFEADLRAPDAALSVVWGDGPAVAAVNLTRGVPSSVPAAALYACCPAPAGTPPRSLGLAAGPTSAAARLSAVLELVERDAAASWWSGETRPSAVSVCDAAPTAAKLARMRAGAIGPGRLTTLLVLPSLTGLPVACAMSREIRRRGLAFGFKAALDMQTAIEGAVTELLQMELSLDLARLRSAQGRRLPQDDGPLQRAALDPDAYAAFAPVPPGATEFPSVAGLDDLVAHLSGSGLEVTVADLPVPGAGLRVAKAFVPGLRPLPGPGPDPRPGSPATKAALM